MTTQAIQKAQSGAITLGAQFGYTPEYVGLIKETYAKDATDNELQMFLDVCHSTKLNPFAKEIYFWKQQGKVIIHTGIDGYRLIADRTGCYAPGPPIKRTYDEKGNHTASTAYVRKKVGSDWFVIEETAHMNEWRKDSPFWKDANKASHQLDITAERHALRKAFPRNFPQSLAQSGPNGEFLTDDQASDTPEQAEQRKRLISNLLRIGKLFCNDDQYVSLEAAVRTSALPVLEERYANALVKLREYVLAEIGQKLQGEAYSAFIVAGFPSGLEAADAEDFFSVLDRLENVVPGEVVETATAEHIDEEPDPFDSTATPIDPDESKLIDLRAAVQQLLVEKIGGMATDQKRFLRGRVIENEGIETLTAMYEELNSI